MRSGTPIYTDGSRASVTQWMGPGVVAYLVVFGLFSNQGIALILAFPLAFYVAYTWHTGYAVFQDVLIIRYFWPRETVVPLAEIVAVRQSRVFPAGDGMLVSRPAKGPLFIRPRDPARLGEVLEPRIGRPPQPANTRNAQNDTPEPKPRRPRRRRRRNLRR